MNERFWKTSLCALAALAAMHVSQANAQVANGTNKSWQVKYHKTTGNPKSSDVAVRLKIRAVAGTDNLTATLTRYDKTIAMGGSERYTKRDGAAGQVELTGMITGNSGGGNQRKREEFLLGGLYFDAHSHPHVVLVKGFHHTGRSKAAADRTDDQLCMRIIDKPYFSSFAMAAPAPAGAAPAPSEPCDEQPPDEDVLTEEDVNDTTPTDPDYDGGS